MNSNRRAFIPSLILLYFFIHYTADLFYFLDPWQSLLQFFQYILICGVLYYAGYRVFKNSERYTLAFSTILFLFLFFGSLSDTAVSMNLLKPMTRISITAVILFTLGCGVIILACCWLKIFFVKKLLQFWLIWTMALAVYDAGTFLLSGKMEKKYLQVPQDTRTFLAAEKPSVFFLLFDMYPSDTVLRKYLGYDNVAFNSFLKEKGFFVAGNAHSLYVETYYSLASTLSLQPLDYFSDHTIEDYKKKLIALKNIEHSSLPGIFERSGYLFRNYSVFDLQGQYSPLQFNLTYHIKNALTAATFFNRFYDTFEPDLFLINRYIDASFLKKSWSSSVNADLDFLGTRLNHLLDSFPLFKRPSFNYFHFMIPHPPIIYDSTGKLQPLENMYSYNGFDKTNANFAGYIKYGNEVIKKMINNIFERSGGNVIIIVQGDHGYREFNDRFPDAVRYGAFNAVYLPGKNYRNFNDSMTVLHTFRQLLKNQFGFESDGFSD